MLSESLKRILNGLAQQDAGEYLPMNDKLEALGMGAETRVATRAVAPPRNATTMPSAHRIALISDGRGAGAPLDYVIDASSRQGAKIDLLIHGTVDTADISTLEKQILAAGIDYHLIQLGVQPIEDIADYICNHPSLIFLVAMPDDSVARTLVEEVIPQRGGRVPVPLVLIEDRDSSRQTEQSAA